MKEILQEVVEAYGNFQGKVAGVLPFGQGHVNDSFCAYVQLESGDCQRYILQRMSAVAFKNPEGLMENIVAVTSYLRKLIEEEGGDALRETMTVCPTTSGDMKFIDSQGRYWRCYLFIEGADCLQKVEREEDFYASAYAFGRFQTLLSGFPVETLHETIPRFHDTEHRLAVLEQAIVEDSHGRVKDATAEIEFIRARAEDCSVCLEAHRQGKLPLRVTHNDTKLNNVMIDKVTGKGICVIDLDTVMAGFSVNDFGDSIRFGANHSAEDQRDLSLVQFDLPLFECYTKGFLEGAKLTEEEIAYLPWGAKLMTLECGIRFLTDYFQGDIYFRTSREGQNLDRCRTQLKLVADMEAVWEEMEDIIKKYQ